jgi:branched-chain amino acid transport system permease protein
MWILTRTAFGQLAAATRENEERVRFSGQSTYSIRLVAMVLAGGFAGVAGALHAINIEQVSVEQFSLKTSAFAMFMCVIGGARMFYGPILGAVLLSVRDKVLPGYTGSWPMYLGLVFCAVLMFSPDGLAGIGKSIAQAFRTPGARFQVLGRLLAVSVLAFGTILGVEMATVWSSQEALVVRDAVPVLGLSVDATSPMYWLLALLLIAAGALGAKHLVPPAKSARAEVPHA